LKPIFLKKGFFIRLFGTKCIYTRRCAFRDFWREKNMRSYLEEEEEEEWEEEEEEEEW
jgi:hypothetical protein